MRQAEINEIIKSMEGNLVRTPFDLKNNVQSLVKRIDTNYCI